MSQLFFVVWGLSALLPALCAMHHSIKTRDMVRRLDKIVAQLIANKELP